MCVSPRCSATVEVVEGGGGGPPGISGKGGGRSANEGVEEINRAACRGAVHRSAGARSVGLTGQEKRCSVVVSCVSGGPTQGGYGWTKSNLVRDDR